MFEGFWKTATLKSDDFTAYVFALVFIQQLNPYEKWRKVVYCFKHSDWAKKKSIDIIQWNQRGLSVTVSVYLSGWWFKCLRTISDLLLDGMVVASYFLCTDFQTVQTLQFEMLNWLHICFCNHRNTIEALFNVFVWTLWFPFLPLWNLSFLLCLSY